MRTFKSSMDRMGNNEDVNLSLCQFLISYRSTSHATTAASPAELLIRRNMRTLFDLIRPDVTSHVRLGQEKAKEDFGGSSPVRTFSPGEEVWVQTFSKNQQKWSLGKVKRAMGPVSYEVEVEDRTMKRHVDHMLSSAATKPRRVEWEAELSSPTAISAERTPTPSPCSTVVVPSPRSVDGSLTPVAAAAATQRSPIRNEAATPVTSHQPAPEGRRYNMRPDRKKPTRLGI